jgi:hypothetical protein
LTSGATTVVKVPEMELKRLFKSSDLQGACNLPTFEIVKDETGAALDGGAENIFTVVDGKMRLDLTTPATVVGTHSVFIRAKPVENPSASWVYRPFKLNLIGPRDAATCNGGYTITRITPNKCLTSCPDGWTGDGNNCSRISSTNLASFKTATSPADLTTLDSVSKRVEWAATNKETWIYCTYPIINLWYDTSNSGTQQVESTLTMDEIFGTSISIADNNCAPI